VRILKVGKKPRAKRLEMPRLIDWDNPETQRIIRAARCYVRRDRGLEYPSGTRLWRGRQGGIWLPSNGEWQECCNHIKPPIPNYPFTHYRHCKTIKHIIHLYKVDYKATKEFINLIVKGVIPMEDSKIGKHKRVLRIRT